MKRAIFWLITFAAIFGACLTLPRENGNVPGEYASMTVPDLTASNTIAAGRAIFLSDCAARHGMTGNGQGSVQPKSGPSPADFTDRTKSSTRTPAYLFWRISEGGRIEPYRTQGSIMPTWKFQLSQDQIWQVIAYIRTLAP